MSSKTKPAPSPSQTVSSAQNFPRAKAKPGDNVLTSEAILHDIAEFKKRGGRIDVLGNTPLRTNTTAFHSSTSAASKKPPTPVSKAAKSAEKAADKSAD